MDPVRAAVTGGQFHKEARQLGAVGRGYRATTACSFTGLITKLLAESSPVAAATSSAFYFPDVFQRDEPLVAP